MIGNREFWLSLTWVLVCVALSVFILMTKACTSSTGVEVHYRSDHDEWQDAGRGLRVRVLTIDSIRCVALATKVSGDIALSCDWQTAPVPPSFMERPDSL